MFPEGAVARGEPMLEQVFTEGLHPMGRVRARAGEQCESYFPNHTSLHRNDLLIYYSNLDMYYSIYSVH